MAKDGRSGERDPLGKQLMQFGDPDWVTLAGCAAAAVAGLMGVAVGAVLGFKIIVMAVSAVVFLAGVGRGVAEWLASRVRFEVRKKGVRLTDTRGVAELEWAEMTRVGVDKALGRGPVLRVVHHDLQTETFRGKGVLYTFTFRAENDRIAVSAWTIRRGPDPQSLLKLVEKCVGPEKVDVREPDAGHIFLDD